MALRQWSKEKSAVIKWQKNGKKLQNVGSRLDWHCNALWWSFLVRWQHDTVTFHTRFHSKSKSLYIAMACFDSMHQCVRACVCTVAIYLCVCERIVYEMFGRRIINNTLFDKLLPFYYPIFPFWQLYCAQHTLISHVQTAEHDFFIAASGIFVVVVCERERWARITCPFCAISELFFFLSSIYSVKKACTNNRTNRIEKNPTTSEREYEWSGDAVDMIFACFFFLLEFVLPSHMFHCLVSFFALLVVVATKFNCMLFLGEKRRTHRNRKFIPKNYRS